MTLTTITPIDIYLAEQADLTAVRRFSQLHEAGALPQTDGFYRDLIPMQRPGPGQQYGFEVDLDACTGCKACVTACHNLNGLDEGEVWRSVGLLHGSNGTPHRQTVTTACHHCVDPACMNGCPANAYTKDATTGIVKHLDDQCIGCGYCTFMCPYEVPRYNERLGIVRKCDMCADRLAAGEAPACVQGCPNDAIRISLVEIDELVAASQTAAIVADAPPSSITVPTTTYRSARHQPDLIAADHFALRPALAHPPLALMLVLTQLSVGAFVSDLVLKLVGSGTGQLRSYNASLALLLGLLALGASVFHLGRPRLAFRAALGVTHSWLSREIVAFGAFAGLAAAYAATLLVGRPLGADIVLGPLVAVVGVVGVACSMMVYGVTRRTWWRVRSVAPKFFLTTATCGLATVLLSASVVAGALFRPVASALMVATVLKLAYEASIFRHLLRDADTDLKRTATLLKRDLAAWTRMRFGAGALGGLLLPVAAAVPSSGAGRATIAAAALIMVTAGELIERTQFFRAVVAPSMPGGMAA